MLRVVDQFHTRDGEWYPSDKPYSITKEAAEKYSDLATGAAHHVFVRVPVGSYVVEFNTQDGKNKIEAYYRDNPWVNFPMFDGHKYNPSNGEVGPGLIRIDGEKVVEGIGLPFGYHVSSFYVVEDVEPMPVPSEPPVPAGQDSIKLIVNDVVVWER